MLRNGWKRGSDVVLLSFAVELALASFDLVILDLFADTVTFLFCFAFLLKVFLGVALLCG